jgi:hypothetical protein
VRRMGSNQVGMDDPVIGGSIIGGVQTLSKLILSRISLERMGRVANAGTLQMADVYSARSMYTRDSCQGQRWNDKTRRT